MLIMRCLSSFALVRGLADTEVFDLSLPMWTLVIFAFLIARLRQKEGFV